MRQTTRLIDFSKNIALAATSLVALASTSSAQIRYELIVPEVMGTPVNHVSSQSNEINENGETLLNRITTFAVWKDGAITHIASGQSDYPATFSSVKAASINRYQQVVGSKTYRRRYEGSAHFDTFPFYWDASNGLVDLDDLGWRDENGAGTTLLYEINENGLALGTTEVAEGSSATGTKAFTWSFETGQTEIEPLDKIGNYSDTRPQGLNRSGTVVGTFRQFGATADSYNERAFIYDCTNGSRDLAEVDSAFFQADHYTARDISDAGMLVGERDRNAFLYDLDSKKGYEITLADGSNRSTKAHSVNENQVVAGTAENEGGAGFSPFIWTQRSGVIELLPHLQRSLQRLLPEGVAPDACMVTPKSINNEGLISASLETQTTFSREVVLRPVLDFRWDATEVVTENGITGALYTHDKTDLDGSIPASLLGYEIVFECSSDMSTWHPISPDRDGIRHLETDTSIELFLPFSDCIFVRPVLKPLQSEAQTGV